MSDTETAEDMFIQAEAALMELDAMARGEILGDPVSVGSAFRRLANAYGVERHDRDYSVAGSAPSMRPEISHVQPV